MYQSVRRLKCERVKSLSTTHHMLGYPDIFSLVSRDGRGEHMPVLHRASYSLMLTLRAVKVILIHYYQPDMASVEARPHYASTQSLSHLGALVPLHIVSLRQSKYLKDSKLLGIKMLVMFIIGCIDEEGLAKICISRLT